MRMVSLPTRGTSLRFTASWATSRTVQRALRRATAYHGNQPLFLGIIQQLCGTGPLALIQRPFQATAPVAMTHLSNRLRCKWNSGRDSRCAYTLGQLPQRQSAQNDSDRLHPAGQQGLEFLLVFSGDFDVQGRMSHALSMHQHNPV
jgi:hypothetical protein